MLIDKLRIDYLVFIGSMRKDNVKPFAKTLISLVNWFSIFKHYNYARWLSVHIREFPHDISPTLSRILKRKFWDADFK